MILIIGSGLSGSTCARKLAESGKSVQVIEKNNFIGGNCYDTIHPITKQLFSAYGPHFFHTNNEEVWEFVNRFAEWIPYSPRMLSRVGNSYVPVPVCQQTVNQLYNLRISSEEEMNEWLTSERPQFRPTDILNGHF